MRPWTTQDSAETYNIVNWSNGFFKINSQGHISATPAGAEGGSIDLYDLVESLQLRGIQAPILLRFPDILRSRIETMVGAFETAIREYEYEGKYRGVYPIKVNQQRLVVEDIVRFSAPHHLGLEAGSKPELLVVLALLEDPDALIICNGYKDDEYIETALLAQRLGRTPVIVIEKFTEIDRVLSVARRLKIRPNIGMRSKLARPGKGRWKTSAGDHSKFGLTAREMVLGVKKLEKEGYLDCLKLLHFHIGSQVTSIRSFKDAVREGARTYAELVRMGAPMGLFDVGGGLGVDYDGSRTDFESSVNYTEQEYAYDIVAGIQAACEKAGISHPNIITEAGRATVAHHSVLLFNVLGVSRFPSEGPVEALEEDAPETLQRMHEACAGITRKNYQEAWHDVIALKEEVLTAFNLGLLSLEDRARAEHLFWQACGRIRSCVRQASYVPEELLGLERSLADT
jgi:arginine decarboxylase